MKKWNATLVYESMPRHDLQWLISVFRLAYAAFGHLGQLIAKIVASSTKQRTES